MNAVNKALTVSTFASMLTFSNNALALDLIVAGSSNYGGGAIGIIQPLTIAPGDAKVGYGLGVLGQHKISDDVSIESGLLYFKEGGSYTIGNAPTPMPGMTADTDASLELTFMRVPVVAHYAFNKMFSVGGGVYYAMATGNVTGTSETSMAGVVVAKADVSKSPDEFGLNKNDYGLVLDTTFDYPVADNVGFYSSLKYSHGLADMAKSDNDMPDQFFNSFKVRDFGLLLGVKRAI